MFRSGNTRVLGAVRTIRALPGTPAPRYHPSATTLRDAAAGGKKRFAFHLQANKSGVRKTIYAVNGEQYTGEWQDNLHHGRGCLKYCNGAKYEGDWQRGVRHGLGTLWELSGGRYRVQYHGQWRDDVPCGRGTLHEGAGDVYEGEWLQGKRHGKGTMTYRGGDVNGAEVCTYEGQWCEDTRHGHGTMEYANGSVYEGSWKDDVRCGEGCWWSERRGLKFDGTWAADTPVSGAYTNVAGSDSSRMLPVVEVAAPGVRA
jgi:hypothetical protein